MTESRDVYSRITSKIIADLELGIRLGTRLGAPTMPPARLPFRCGIKVPYKGINVVMLWSASAVKLKIVDYADVNLVSISDLGGRQFDDFQSNIFKKIGIFD